MPCERYIDLILDSLDHSLPVEHQRELVAHLETCETCRSLYDTYHNIDEALCYMEEPPEELKTSVMKAISNEKESKKKFTLKRYRFTAIAACAAIAVLFAGRAMPTFISSTADTAGTEVLYDMAEEDMIATAAGVQEETQTMEEMSRDFAAYDGGGASETVYVELSEAGCSGRLLVIYPEQEDVVSGFEQISIPSGYPVYYISSAQFVEIAHVLNPFEELLLPGEDTGDIYVMID